MADRSKASVDALSALHAKLAETFTQQIDRYVVNNEPIPPSLLAAVAKFLKDNDITADPAPNSPLGRLKDVISVDMPFQQH